MCSRASVLVLVSAWTGLLLWASYEDTHQRLSPSVFHAQMLSWFGNSICPATWSHPKIFEEIIFIWYQAKNGYFYVQSEKMIPSQWWECLCYQTLPGMFSRWRKREDHARAVQYAQAHVTCQKCQCKYRCATHEQMCHKTVCIVFMIVIFSMKCECEGWIKPPHFHLPQHIVDFGLRHKALIVIFSTEDQRERKRGELTKLFQKKSKLRSNIFKKIYL